MELEIEPILSFAPKVLIESLTHDAFENLAPQKVPTSRKINGVLLFVDISGFTALANKVSIDDLQSIINGYFDLLFQVISRYDGDIVKYAGDAFFVLWTVDGDKSDDLSHCVVNAAACGEDLNRKCCDYRVKVKSELSSWLLNSTAEVASSSGEYTSFILNVHSSISCGYFSFLNVGHDGRWECFLLGEPVNDLAKTIDQAGIGKLVMTKSAHDAMERWQVKTSFEIGGSDSYHANCECKLLNHDCFEFCSSGHEELLAKFRVAASAHSTSSLELLNESIKSYAQLRSSTQRGTVKVAQIVDYIRDGIVGHVHEAIRPSMGLGMSSGHGEQDALNGESGGVRTLSTYGSRRNVLRTETGSNIFASKCSGELRMVVTVFIKINVENFCSERGAKSVGAEDPTLTTLQNCIRICISELNVMGGQLRQFIVDDKGCVCIGTFGLHMSVTSDDCGAAVSAAQSIEMALKEIGLQSSIGITSGEAYCGLVGAPQRHEYTVMGTSVNLAARLMAAASKELKAAQLVSTPESSTIPPLSPNRSRGRGGYEPKAFLGYIRCDDKIQMLDRSHSFVALDHVIAKGYSEPVMTFRPVRSRSYDPLAVVSSFNGFPMKPTVCGDLFNGRIGELEEAIEFFFRNGRAGDAPSSFFPPECDETQMVDKSDWPSKVFVVVGNVSIGIELYLTSLVQLMGLLSPPLNCISFRCKCSRSKSATRFVIWRNLFGDFLTHIGSLAASSKSSTSSSRTQKPLKFLALDLILNRLPPPTRELVPLLALYGLIPKTMGSQLPTSSTIESMTNEEKLNKAMEFLTKALEVATAYLRERSTFASIVFVIDHVEHIDISSWQLIETIVQKCCGVSFLLSFGMVEKKEANWKDGSDELSDLGSIYSVSTVSAADYHQQDDDDISEASGRRSQFVGDEMRWSNFSKLRAALNNGTSEKAEFKCLHLGPLSRDSVMQFVLSVCIKFFPIDTKYLDGESEENTRRINDTLDKLYFASGGHPLHVLEIASSVVQSGKCYSTMMFFDKLDKVLSKIKSNNIDDLIYFNFDQLSPECQLVLKAASVVASSGTPVSCCLLGHMLTNIRDVAGIESTPDYDRDARDAEGEFHEIDHGPSDPPTSTSATAPPTSTSTTEAIMQAMKQILSCSTFLTPFDPKVHELEEEISNISLHTTKDEVDFDENTLFRFSSSIYQQPLYNMMLNQQKRDFHGSFATYLEQKCLAETETKGSMNPQPWGIETSTNPTLWHTQGFHWHHAGCWMKALACFFQAAKVLVAEGSFNDANMYFCWSYNMLQALRQENGMAVTHRISMATSSGQYILSHIGSAKGKAYHNDDSEIQGGDPKDTDEQTVTIASCSSRSGDSANDSLLRMVEMADFDFGAKLLAMGESDIAEVVHEIFKGDSLSLEVTIMMLIRFSQSLVVTQEDQTIVSVILMEALQLIMTSRKSAMKVASKRLNIPFFHKPHLDSTLHGHLASSDGEFEEGSKQISKRFHLRDNAVIFPILSALCAQYMSGHSNDDKAYSNLEGLIQVFMAVANEHGDAVHIIRALMVSDWRLTALRERRAVIKVVNEIRHLYRFEKHSHKLIETYGIDGALKCLVSGVQNRLFMGDFSGANENYAFIRKLIPKFKHVHSLEVSVVPLCVCLMLMEMFDEAVDLFFEYFVIESTAVGHSMFRDQNPYVAEMLLQISNLSEEQKDVLRKSVRGGSWLDDVRLMSSDGKPIATRRSPSVATLEMSGFGIDCAKAKLCYLMGKRSFRDRKCVVDAASVDTLLASLHFAQSMPAANQLNHLNALWIKADTLALLTEIYAGNDFMMEEAYAILSLDATVESLLLSRDMQSPLLDLLAGQRADTILATTQSAYCSPGRLIRQGRVAELSAAAILAFSEEKTRPLLDFSRSIPIRSLKRDEKSVKVKVNSNVQTTITFWTRWRQPDK